jgi:TerC family integral membrane protein
MQNLVWLFFLVFVLLMVFLDLGVFHRKAHRISVREALAWTGIWVAVALCFNVFVYFLYGHNWLGWTDLHSHDLTGRQAAVQFFTGYVVEKSLSVDNIFVIAMIFSFFRIPSEHQHRVLFWGILGAVLMRGVMIAVGAIIIERFSWSAYVFGLVILASAVKMLITRHETIEPEKNWLVRFAHRLYPTAPNTDGAFFVCNADGRTAITHTFLALLMVETTDVMFALDSIPAIFSITRDPFLVFTSNIFAMLGLRSLYFAVAGLMDKFRYLKMSLVFLLAYVGVKMMLVHHYPIPNLVSLAVIAGILMVGVAASIIGGGKDPAHLVGPPINDASDNPSA